MLKYFCLFICCCLFSSYAHGYSLWPTQGAHSISIGPEFYHLNRTKKGGSHQSGLIFGGNALYEYRPDFGFYLAADGSYCRGKISGETASSSPLESKLTDRQAEGRVGYSFYFNFLKKIHFTPYGGYGILYSDNKYQSPSPLRCTFHNRFDYALAGLSTRFFGNPCTSFGLNLKAKFMREGECTIEDPEIDDVTIQMSEKIQYEIELPFRYKRCINQHSLTLNITPFYQARHYGGRINYPFDFVETKFKIYGAKFLVSYNF